MALPTTIERLNAHLIGFVRAYTFQLARGIEPQLPHAGEGIDIPGHQAALQAARAIVRIARDKLDVRRMLSAMDSYLAGMGRDISEPFARLIEELGDKGSGAPATAAPVVVHAATEPAAPAEAAPPVVEQAPAAESEKTVAEVLPQPLEYAAVSAPESTNEPVADVVVPDAVETHTTAAPAVEANVVAANEVDAHAVDAPAVDAPAVEANAADANTADANTADANAADAHAVEESVPAAPASDLSAIADAPADPVAVESTDANR